jgi:hypothetical protein
MSIFSRELKVNYRAASDASILGNGPMQPEPARLDCGSLHFYLILSCVRHLNFPLRKKIKLI